MIAAAALLALSAAPARAAEVCVLAPGLVGTGVITLSQKWAAETGNTVRFPDPASVSKYVQMVQSDYVCDVVLLPPADMGHVQSKLRTGSERPMGRVIFGLAVKHGAPHPDISTLAKFRNALGGH